MPETLAECAPLSFGSYRANLQNKTSSRQYTFRKILTFASSRTIVRLQNLACSIEYRVNPGAGDFCHARRDQPMKQEHP